jgi:signal peptidase I
MAMNNEGMQEENKNNTKFSIGMDEIKKEEAPKGFLKSFWGELLQIVVISLVIVIPFRTYIAQPFLVSGPSMDDTFANGQYLIVDELTYRTRNPERGEVIIFHYPLDTKKFFIKRIIGLPGETVEIKNDTVTICKPDCITDTNKFALVEPYVKSSELDQFRPNSTVTLKENEYFVLGDNRAVSSDSRIWGPVKREFITGRPVLRLLPLKEIGLFPGEVKN